MRYLIFGNGFIGAELYDYFKKKNKTLLFSHSPKKKIYKQKKILFL